jgi:hypothetical protein
VPAIDIVDSTWICARPSVVAAVVAEPANWRRWWPDLDLSLDEWRGDKGVRWTVRRAPHGGSGSMEVWLEQACDGVVAHFFLRLDAARGGMTPRRADRVADRYRRRMKRIFWALADELDPGRIARIASPAGT